LDAYHLILPHADLASNCDILTAHFDIKINAADDIGGCNGIITHLVYQSGMSGGSGRRLLRVVRRRLR
jgi:hypothetical protein